MPLERSFEDLLRTLGTVGHGWRLVHRLLLKSTPRSPVLESDLVEVDSRWGAFLCAALRPASGAFTTVSAVVPSTEKTGNTEVKKVPCLPPPRTPSPRQPALFAGIWLHFCTFPALLASRASLPLQCGITYDYISQISFQREGMGVVCLVLSFLRSRGS